MKLINIKTKKVYHENGSITSESTGRNPVSYYVADIIDSVWSGEKFPGGYGLTKDYTYVDYWVLRKRSVQLFKENIYARGMLRRLVRNLIHKGLKLEANNIQSITGLDDEKALEWDEKTELEFDLWANNKNLCDWKKQKTFGELQDECKMTAMVSGDCLVVQHIDQKTGLPSIELIDGQHIQTPFNQQPRQGNKIFHGVEIDKFNRHVAYWVRVINGLGFEFKRIPCYGEKSKLRIAWLVYGCDKLMDEVRGEPILAIALYSLKEVDRYKDAEQRAATMNAILPLIITKDQPGIGSHPINGGAVRRGGVTTTDFDDTSRTFNISTMLPGTIPEELAPGEKIDSFATARPNVNLGKYEEIIINAVAWMLELPPEIARLLFQSNFSASRQANNELDIKISYESWKFGNNFCKQPYEEFVTSSVLNGTLEAQGFLEAYYTNNWRILGAWFNAEWSGLSRPSVDILKEANAADKAIQTPVSNYDFWCRRISGMSFRTVAKKLAREKALLDQLGISFRTNETATGEPAEQQANEIALSLVEINDKLDDMQN